MKPDPIILEHLTAPQPTIIEQLMVAGTATIWLLIIGSIGFIIGWQLGKWYAAYNNKKEVSR